MYSSHKRSVAGLGTVVGMLGAFLVLIVGAFHHVEAASFEGLGDLPGGSHGSYPIAISPDGTVVVGQGNSVCPYSPISCNDAYRWTSATGIMSIGDLPGGHFLSQANAVSTNGDVVVGEAESSLAGREAFRWTMSGGMVPLVPPPAGSFLDPSNRYSGASGVSGDGTIVVGESQSPTGIQAYQWTALHGMVGLGYLSGASSGNSSATGISEDGSIIVGYSNGI